MTLPYREPLETIEAGPRVISNRRVAARKAATLARSAAGTQRHRSGPTSTGRFTQRLEEAFRAPCGWRAGLLDLFADMPDDYAAEFGRVCRAVDRAILEPRRHRARTSIQMGRRRLAFPCLVPAAASGFSRGKRAPTCQSGKT